MIHVLITPVKNRRDSILETPTCKLTFDVSETPVLFDSGLSFKQLQKLHALNVVNSTTNNKRQSIATQYSDSPSPIIKLFDVNKDDVLTPANIFSKAFNINNNKNNKNINICAEEDERKDLEEDEYTNININNINNDPSCNNIEIIATQNNKISITMMITKKVLSQAKIYQYLVQNSQYYDKPRPSFINNIFKPCACVQCKVHNWNLVDLKWEHKWQTHQFLFTFNNNNKQITRVNCDNVTDILCTNGILQKDIYNEFHKIFYKKISKSNCYSNTNKIKKHKRKIKKNKNRKKDAESTAAKKKDRDKKFILKHLSTWSVASTTSFGSSSDLYTTQNSYTTYNYNYKQQYLPLVSREDNGCSYISCEVLLDVILTDKYSKLFDKYVIIDCRYSYEYAGGHINGAISIQDKLLLKLLFKSNMNNINSNRICWIFHCEYSKHRAPKTCKYFRKLDRELNQDRYPHISYPHVYVLEGGYKKFWNKYKNSYKAIKNKLFKPYGYITMWSNVFDDKRYIHSKFREESWNKNKKKNKTKLL